MRPESGWQSTAAMVPVTRPVGPRLARVADRSRARHAGGRPRGSGSASGVGPARAGFGRVVATLGHGAAEEAGSVAALGAGEVAGQAPAMRGKEGGRLAQAQVHHLLGIEEVAVARGGRRPNGGPVGRVHRVVEGRWESDLRSEAVAAGRCTAEARPAPHWAVITPSGVSGSTQPPTTRPGAGSTPWYTLTIVSTACAG